MGENMNIKMLVMDMDGTLLQHDGTILPKTKELLLACQEQGIRLLLASGRNNLKLLPYAKELKMDQYGGYLIEINGLALYDMTTGIREVYARIQQEKTYEIFQYFMKCNVEIMAIFDDGIYDYIPKSIMSEKEVYRKEHHLPNHYPWTAGAFDFVFDNIGYPKLTYIQNPNEIIIPVNKICVAYHEAVLTEIALQAKKDLGNKYWVGLTSPRWLEIMPLNITKGNALKNLCQRLHMNLNQVMAFGDGENDIEMLTTVGYGIAMGNALDSVKEIAYEVCDRYDENGIANIIEKYKLVNN